jgi:hypothetical protein
LQRMRELPRLLLHRTDEDKTEQTGERSALCYKTKRRHEKR